MTSLDLKSWWRRRRIFAAVFLPYWVFFSVLAISRGSGEFAIYAAVMIGLALLVAALDRRVNLPDHTIWLLLTWGLLHMAGGTVPIPHGDGGPPVLYGLRVHPALPRYDQVVHAFGFFAATLVCWHALRGGTRWLGELKPSVGLVIAAALMSVGLGGMNEVIEFAATQVLPETGVGGYENTGWDLVSNAVGAACGAAFILVRGAREIEPTIAPPLRP